MNSYDPNYIPGGGKVAWLGMTFAGGVFAVIAMLIIVWLAA